MGETVPNKNLFGRTVLYTNEEKIERANVVKVLASVLSDFNKNKKDIDYLYQYVNGNQPILKRTKKVRPEINNKVVENHAREIVDFKKGYDFGEPLQYFRRATKSGKELKENPNTELTEEDSTVSKNIALLNEFMFLVDKETQDKDLAEWFFICGTAYRMVLPTDDEDEIGSPFEIDTLDPRYTGVVYHRGFGRKPLMSFQEVKIDDEAIRYCVYTKSEYFEITLEKGKNPDDLSEKDITLCESHTLNNVPVIEYPANIARMGSFELVISLLDEINNVESNRIDGVEQFVQAFMKFINVQISKEQYEELKEMGAIAFKSDPNCPADIGIVSAEMNQEQIQTIVDHLYQMVLIICGMPDRNGANRTTGDTGQAVILRDGWSAAEAKSKDVEGMFKRSEKKFLKVVLHIIEDVENVSINLSDIDVKFRPNKTDNILTKVQAMNLMMQSGVHPLVSMAKVGLFSDPEQVYIDSLPYLNKAWQRDSANQDINKNVNVDGSKQKKNLSNEFD